MSEIAAVSAGRGNTVDATAGDSEASNARHTALDRTEALKAAQALGAMDAARGAMVEWRDAVEASLRAAQAATEEAHKSLEATRAELALVKQERDQWRDECDQHRQSVGDLRSNLAAQIDRNRRIRDELGEVYRDLRSEDVPTLVLRLGVNLTHADDGLFVNADGSQTLADTGLEEMPETCRQALYAYTRRAAQQEAAVVCNDADSLPDGANLVNLAALPVAVQGDLKGVILVANKRSGPFTEEDTELLLSIGKHAGIAMENRRLHRAVQESFVSTIAVLADAIEAKDPYTRGHCENVSLIAVKVAERMGLKGEELDHLRYAALLHDVGKIGIPDGILLKPGRLLPEEYQMIQRHASIGSDLVQRVASLVPIAPAILHHHERFDGTGYPDGLSGEAILLASRIVGVVDALDAMTTPRPYRNAISKPEALAELERCAGKQFDPAVVALLGEVLQEMEGGN